MKILLFGKNGQVGWELQRSLSILGNIYSVSRKEIDLEDTKNISKIIREKQPDILVNAAAYTSVDKAESNSKLAYKINAQAVEIMAREMVRLSGWIVHYSTDYIFDGSKTSPYNEDDQTHPLSIYGKSKLKGEELIRETNPKHLIFRTSWVYSSRGDNFAKTMLRLGKEKDELKVVGDQLGAPTSAELIADVTALAMYRLKQSIDDRKLSGTYHLASSGETSWYGFAKAVIEQAQSQGVQLKIKAEDIQEINSESYPMPAPRPLNSRLNTAKLCNAFNIIIPTWQHHAQRIVNQLIEMERH